MDAVPGEPESLARTHEGLSPLVLRSLTKTWGPRRACGPATSSARPTCLPGSRARVRRGRCPRSRWRPIAALGYAGGVGGRRRSRPRPFHPPRRAGRGARRRARRHRIVTIDDILHLAEKETTEDIHKLGGVGGAVTSPT